MTAPLPSIDQLKELALPAPVSYWPQTWGWWLLLALLVLGLLGWTGWRYRQWRRDAYRREALARLTALQRHDPSLPALRELPQLIKRVALSLPGARREVVAALGGEQWQQFLHARDPSLPADFGQQLAVLAYAPDSRLSALTEAQRADLFSHCRHWVEHHHVAA